MPPKTVFITGCSGGGIGDALAQEFKKQGLRVFASARDSKEMLHLKDLEIETLTLDVTSALSIRTAVDIVEEATGGSLDLLINCAGSTYLMPLLDSEIEAGKRLYDVNVFGVIAVTQAFFPLLKNARGTVANMGSIVGVGPLASYQCFYSSSKAALHSIGDSMRNEFAPFGVKVVTIVTGSVSSNLFTNAAATVLPRNSLYTPIKEFIEKRTFVTGQKETPRREYARQVAKDLLGNPQALLWRGAYATMIWCVWCFSWVGMMDKAILKQAGLDKLKAAQSSSE